MFSPQLRTFIEREELKQLQLGYAITIHKSQGGEAPVVILTVTIQHDIMLVRNLYCTGLTRAKERDMFIDTYKAMDIAIRNNTIAIGFILIHFIRN
ncbi:ATP-binding domain-containing protein [Pseudobacillus badius]|uniref:ATP-binding domain-containing protein n=1 Tax=Bacillus badius TaxID=1455 RepID=UPI003CEA5E27